MDREDLKLILQQFPVLAAVHSLDEAVFAASSHVKVVVLLGGELPELAQSAQILKKAGKKVFVHLDLVNGFSKDAHAVRLLVRELEPDGILTTRGNLIGTIQNCGVLAGLRCFLLDGKSYQMAVKQVRAINPDFAEVMPGIMPEIVKNMSRDVRAIIIAGGFIRTAHQAEQIFRAGASGLSTSVRTLWNLS